MATANTDAYKLKNVDWEGLIHEDVMDKLFSIDPVDTPLMDMAGRAEASKNQYRSWVQESLAAPDITNARVDGADAGDAAAFDERRIGNHHQISDKVVKVSDRANAVDTIGYRKRLAHEIMVRQKELRRDVEAILCSNQASVEGTTSVAGKTAGAGAMFETNIVNGTAGGFSNGIFSAPTPGAAAGLKIADLDAAAELAYNEGGNPSVLMSSPKMIAAISRFLLSPDARIATLMSEQNNADSGKYGSQGLKAISAVNVYVTDFDTLEFVPNRTMQAYDNGGTDCVNVYLFDPAYWEVGFLQGFEVKPLARTGTAENRQMTVDYTLLALQEKSSAVLMGIDPTVAVAA